MDHPPERHFEFDEPPRLYVEHYLAARIGDFSGSDEATRRFLARYDATPTLAALGAGLPCDRDLFVLALAVLVDEGCRASRLRLERNLRRCGFLELTPDLAGSLARLRQDVAAETSTLGPSYPKRSPALSMYPCGISLARAASEIASCMRSTSRSAVSVVSA